MTVHTSWCLTHHEVVRIYWNKKVFKITLFLRSHHISIIKWIKLFKSVKLSSPNLCFIWCYIWNYKMRWKRTNNQSKTNKKNYFGKRYSKSLFDHYSRAPQLVRIVLEYVDEFIVSLLTYLLTYLLTILLNFKLKWYKLYFKYSTCSLNQNKQTNKQTNRQTDRQTDRQTNKQKNNNQISKQDADYSFRFDLKWENLDEDCLENSRRYLTESNFDWRKLAQLGKLNVTGYKIQTIFVAFFVTSLGNVVLWLF